MEGGQPQSSARATVTSKTLSVTLWTSRRPWLQHWLCPGPRSGGSHRGGQWPTAESPLIPLPAPGAPEQDARNE